MFDKVCFRSIMLYRFKKRCTNATIRSKNICDMPGSDVITKRARTLDLKSFGNFDLDDKIRADGLSMLLKQIVTENSAVNSREAIADKTNVKIIQQLFSIYQSNKYIIIFIKEHT